jgi:hypothetical protein
LCVHSMQCRTGPCLIVPVPGKERDSGLDQVISVAGSHTFIYDALSLGLSYYQIFIGKLLFGKLYYYQEE